MLVGHGTVSKRKSRGSGGVETRLGEVLDFVMRAERVSQKEIAERAGMDPGHVSKLRLGRQPLSTKHAAQLADATKLPQQVFFAPLHAPIEGTGSTNREMVAKLTSLAPHITQDPARPHPDVTQMRWDVPLLLTEEYEGPLNRDFSLGKSEGRPVYVRRPPGLAPQQPAQAMHMRAPSMWPWRAVGERIDIDPIRPPGEGSRVVVTFKDGTGVVRELVKRTQDEIILQQYNPVSTQRVPLSEVQEIRRVFEWEELMRFAQ